MQIHIFIHFLDCFVQIFSSRNKSTGRGGSSSSTMIDPKESAQHGTRWKKSTSLKEEKGDKADKNENKSEKKSGRQEKMVELDSDGWTTVIGRKSG